MSNNRGKSVMKSTQSKNTSSGSKSPLRMHNFMPMPTSSVHVNHNQNDAERHAFFMNQHKQKMQSFWRERLSEICDASTDARTPSPLPLTRIRRVIKSDEKVELISGETPILVAKACELFVMELTLRASMHTEDNHRKTMQRTDIAAAIRDEKPLAFLSHLLPMEEPPQHQEPSVPVPVPGPDDGVYVPHPVMPTDYDMYLPSSESGVAAAGSHAMAIDGQHLPFPMNLHDSFNHDFFTRSGGMLDNPSIPPPSPSSDGANMHLSFKDFFQ